MDNYVGRIVKISGTNPWKHPVSKVGIVYAQKEGYKGESTNFTLIKPNGEIESVSVVHNSDTKITATKLDPDLRAALKESYKVKVKLEAFRSKVSQELKRMEGELADTLRIVKETSGELTSNEFIDQINTLLRERYPATGGYYTTKSFSVVCWSATVVTAEQSQDVDKWANPEKYSFLYREYDNTIHISYDSQSYKDFCVRNAPSVIPELAKYCDANIEATLGDKEWLSVGRRYTFPIKHGYSQKSIEEIKMLLFGGRAKPQSIEEQIRDAETRRAGTNSGARVGITKDLSESR